VHVTGVSWEQMLEGGKLHCFLCPPLPSHVSLSMSRTWLEGRQVNRARDRGLLGADAGGGRNAGPPVDSCRSAAALAC